MSEKYVEYRRAAMDTPGKTRLWPLYGAGFENLGVQNDPIEIPLPKFGPDEILVRHDACGLCFSDIKILSLGEKHPRIHKDMKSDPVVMGHEVVMTVIGVGDNLKQQYHVGQRFIVQADIYDKGVNFAYGYMLQGGLSEYAVIGRQVLAGDDGNYLIPIQDTTGYVESALVEPWACVTAGYGLQYRTRMKNAGVAWFVGAPGLASDRPLTLTAGFDSNSHPARIVLTNVPAGLAGWLRERAQQLGVEVVDAPDPANPPIKAADDILVFAPDADLIEKVSPKLGQHGVLAVVTDKPFSRRVGIDVGRIHYNDWVYVGTKETDIAQAYSGTPVRSTLQPGGTCWMAGAGGPIGRMHLQRAIELPGAPAVIVCTDVSDTRLEDLRSTFEHDAKEHLISLVCLNPMKKDQYNEYMSGIKSCGGFDDVVMLVPVPGIISDAATYLGPNGVLNIFAGVNRGTMAELDLNDMLNKHVRVFGHSASSIDDMRMMLRDTETGALSPNRSVAAIGSLEAAKDGLQALKDATYPGKVVIFPNIKYMPVTALPDLKDKLPTVYAKLRDGREWTVEAEEEFLSIMLP